MFNSNIHNKRKEFHVFSSEEITLSSIGLGNYTFLSASGYFSRIFDPAINEYFDSKIISVKDSLLANDTSVLSMLKFNKETLKYDYVSGSDIFRAEDKTPVATTLEEFLNEHRKYNLGRIQDEIREEKIEEVVRNIQTSLSGCLTFRATYKALGSNRNPVIKLFIRDKENSDDSRQIAQRGSPLIVDVPKTSTAVDYSYVGTENSAMGVYQRPFEGGLNNPKNAIAAQLDLRYSSAFGSWQAGTHQILAKLLTDIDPAPSQEINLDLIENASAQSFYDPDNQLYFSKFSIGLALPLSVEAGNPHQFGPNFAGCPIGTSPTKIEKIMVVNRSGRGFKMGDTVLCSHIDNEWIVQGFDAGTVSKNNNTKIGKWSFQKYIVNSDNFFKDARYVKGDTIAGFEGYKNNISPEIYETKIRLKYYVDMFQGEGDSAGPAWSSAAYLKSLGIDFNTIARLNIYVDLPDKDAIKKPMPEKSKYDIDLNAQYYQSTIFDQLSSNFGGTNTDDVIGRTNIKESPNPIVKAEEGDYYPMAKSLPMFWGPVFPDGYSAGQISRLKNPTTFWTYSFSPVSKLDLGLNNKLVRHAGKSKNFFNIGIAIPNDTKSALIDSSNSIFSDIADGNAKQLPAEVATNGKKNAFGSPIEHPPFYVANTVDSLHNYLVSDERYSWLVSLFLNGQGDVVQMEDSYGLTPIKPNYIQFSPLQLEAALHGTSITPKNNNSYLLFNDQINTYVKGLYKKDINFHSQKFHNRNMLAKNGILITNDNVDILATYRFGPYVEQLTVAPLGGPNIIPKENNSSERGNLFGIIAAKNKFTAPANGSITLTTSQYFGLTPNVTLAGGQGPVVTVIGAYLSWSTGSNPIRENANAQWGDRFREDKYDSYGTTALQVRIFDQWPDEQTIYDGRYFSVLHFNPLPTSGNINSNIYEIKSDIVDTGKAYVGTWTPDKLNVSYQRSVDKISTSVDFRVPTFMHPKSIILDNTIVPTGYIIKEDGVYNGNSLVGALRNPSEWRVNPIRRGALLTKGGFKYYKTHLGINGQDYTMSDPGIGYSIGEVISFSRGAKVSVDSINSIGAILSFNIVDSGTNFYTTDFFGSGVKNQGSDANGRGAIIHFRSGKVYNKLEHDLGPQERVGITRLSLPSNMGKEPAEGSLSTPLSLEGGASNNYDAFYFMHNDILHTLMFDTPFTPGFAQYINLEIGAG
jgi:hypothetical protein